MWKVCIMQPRYCAQPRYQVWNFDALYVFAVSFSNLGYAVFKLSSQGVRSFIISTKKLLDADWLRGVQLFH